MSIYKQHLKTNGFETNIYILYLFFLPFSRFIDFNMPHIFQTYLFNRFSCFFFFIGCIIMMVKKVKLYSPILHQWIKLYLFQVVYSLLMACVLFIPLGSLNGEDSIRAVTGGIIFWLIVILHLFYNYYGLTHLIKSKTFFRTVTLATVILLITGYLQYAAINIGGVFNTIYSALTSIFALLPIEHLNRGVVFWGSEPSSASILFILIIPVLVTQIILLAHTKDQKKYILLYILFLPLFLSSNSASVLITLLVNIITTVILLFRNYKFYRIFIFIVFFIGLYVAINYGIGSFNENPTTVSEEQENLKYLLFGKIQDTNNLSTMMRSSTIINNMKIFFEYPLTGIGDGIQGFFYNENIPQNYLLSPEVTKIYNGESGIIDSGGAFFPAFLSSYGIIGLFFLVPLIKQYSNCLRCEKTGHYNLIFLVFIPSFILSAWFNMGIRQNYIVILLFSIPIATLYKNLHNIKE